MAYLLDTNVWIDVLRGANKDVIRRMSLASCDDVRLSSVVLGELLVGANKARSHRPLEAVRLLAESYTMIGIDEREAAAYAEIRTQLEANGQPIGPNDLWIAAQASANDLVLVTANTREFQRVPGLEVENWRTELI